MAQQVKCLLQNHEDKFKCPALPEEGIIPVLRDGKGRYPKLIASQPGRTELHSSERPCLKVRWTGIEGHIQSCPLSSTHMCTHTYTHLCLQMHTPLGAHTYATCTSMHIKLNKMQQLTVSMVGWESISAIPFSVPKNSPTELRANDQNFDLLGYQVVS